MIDIAALVLTYNERDNIERTLRRLVGLPQVVVVDSFSTDETLEIAREQANVTVIQRRFDTFADQCNFGLEAIRAPWVLSLDADYELEEEMVAELQSLDPAAGISGYQARFLYCVWGHPLRTTLYPPRTVLYRREFARYENDGHGHRVRLRTGDVQRLRARIRHDDRKPLSRWLQSQDRYMLIEAPHLLLAPASTLSKQDRLRRRAFLAPAVMFLYLMLARGLILDGWPGWYYVFQRTLAETLLALRLITEREKLESESQE